MSKNAKYWLNPSGHTGCWLSKYLNRIGGNFTLFNEWNPGDSVLLCPDDHLKEDAGLLVRVAPQWENHLRRRSWPNNHKTFLTMSNSYVTWLLNLKHNEFSPVKSWHRYMCNVQSNTKFTGPKFHWFAYLKNCIHCELLNCYAIFLKQEM